MKIKSLISLVIFTAFIVSCEKDMKWINEADENADASEMTKICEREHAECGSVEVEYNGKKTSVFCGECSDGYECGSDYKCADIDECTDSSLNDCNENTDCHNLDMKSDGKPYECICKKNYSGDDCDPDTRTKECAGLPENAEWNTAETITQTWDGIEWMPSTKGEYNKEASETECRFKCVENYFWNGGKCLYDTKTFQCSGLPENAEWNTVSEYTQKWDGKKWSPEDSESEYSEEPSETECRFKCVENYEWNNSQCVAETREADCDPKPANSVWNDNGEEGKLTQTWNGGNWMPPSESTFNKTPGECVFNCATGFYWNNDSCEVAPTRDYGCTDLPANAQWNTAETITQTWDGDEWIPTNIGSYNETASTSECRFKCKENYEWNNSNLACEGAKRTSACTELPENAVWNIASSITQTWSGEEWLPTTTGSYSETASTTECKYKCNNYSEWNGSECVSPCDSNPCNNFTNTNGSCTATSKTTYSCGCNNGYFWNGSECKKLPECSSSSGTPCKDSSSGLIWSTKASTSYTWQNAVNYCSSYSEGGLSGWHLPTISELRTLIKNCSGTVTGGSCGVTDSCLSDSCWSDSCYSCSSDSTGGHSKFGETNPLWSSSTLSDYPDGAWRVGFTYGIVNSLSKTYNGYVRCVR